MKMPLLFLIFLASFSLNAQTPISLQTNIIPIPCPPPKDPNHITEEEGTRILQTLAADVQSYEQHPEYWQGTNLIFVARGYASLTNFEKAIVVYKKLLDVQPDNLDAIRGMSNCYLLVRKYDEAAVEYKYGWALGDDLSLVALANQYCLLHPQYEDIKPYIQDLLKVRERTNKSDVKHEITNDLIMYSLSTHSTESKDVFEKAINGLSDGFILDRDDTAQLVFHGLETFGFQEKADELKAKVTK